MAITCKYRCPSRLSLASSKIRMINQIHQRADSRAPECLRVLLRPARMERMDQVDLQANRPVWGEHKLRLLRRLPLLETAQKQQGPTADSLRSPHRLRESSEFPT